MARRMSNLARLAKGTYGKGGEILDYTYYDSLIEAAAVGVHRLFTVGLGGGAPAKTLDRTNMTTSGSMPQGQNLAIRAIKVWYATAGAFATADIQSFYTMLRSTTIEILLPGKDTMGTWNLMEVFGVAMAAAVTPTAAGDNLPFLSPRFHGVLPLNTPLVLASLTPFEVRVQHHVATAAALDGDFLFIGLNGTLQRAN